MEARLNGAMAVQAEVALNHLARSSAAVYEKAIPAISARKYQTAPATASQAVGASGADEAEDDGVVGVQPVQSTVAVDSASGGGVGAFDEDAPIWPDDASESAYLSEQRGQPESGNASRGGAVEMRSDDDEAESADKAAALPSLDSLIARLTPETREILEDLFRVKFVRVTKLPKKALKEQDSQGSAT